MSYNISFTDNNKLPIIVADKTINYTDTSLTFIGKNYSNYGSYAAENLLHLLENFANAQPPEHPIQGQLWYDSGENVLKMNTDGSSVSWVPSSSVHKSVSEPSQASLGDIWVDTLNKQLKIRVDSSTDPWTIIGPQFTQGTGAVSEEISDSNVDPNTNITKKYKIVSIYSNNTRIAIISDVAQSFIPKNKIAGFSEIHHGLTMMNAYNSDGSINSNNITVYGSVLNASNLDGVSAANYVRKDTDVVFDNGVVVSIPTLKLGASSALTISDDTQGYTFVSSQTNGSLKIKLANNTTQSVSVACFSPASNGRVGIKTDNPEKTLDVNGDIKSSKLYLSDPADITSSEPALYVAGGAKINYSLEVGKDIKTTNGVISVSNIDADNGVQYGPIIVPQETNAYDIGSEDYKFRNLYVNAVNGDLYGNLYGTVISGSSIDGDVSGSAGKLKTPTQFSIAGDFSTTESVLFDGTQTTGVVLEVSAETSLISDKLEITDPDAVAGSDSILIYRKYSAEAVGYISGTTLYIGKLIYGSVELNQTIYVDNESIGTTITGTDPTSPSNPSEFIWKIGSSNNIGTSSAQVILTFGSGNLYKATRNKFLESAPLVKPGCIMLYPGTTAPDGYLKCDGYGSQQDQPGYQIALYPNLYNVLGSSYLVSGYTTHFYVPLINSPVAGFIYVICTG